MQKVLIVDDSLFMRKIIRDTVSLLPVNVVEANNGATAIELFHKITPEIVITNIIMPEVDGLALLKHIKNANLKTEVIICSAQTSQLMKQMAFKLGADEYIQKPFQNSHLLSIVTKMIEKNDQVKFHSKLAN